MGERWVEGREEEDAVVWLKVRFRCTSMPVPALKFEKSSRWMTSDGAGAHPVWDRVGGCTTILGGREFPVVWGRWLVLGYGLLGTGGFETNIF